MVAIAIGLAIAIDGMCVREFFDSAAGALCAPRRAVGIGIGIGIGNPR